MTLLVPVPRGEIIHVFSIYKIMFLPPLSIWLKVTI